MMEVVMWRLKGKDNGEYNYGVSVCLGYKIG